MKYNFNRKIFNRKYLKGYRGELRNESTKAERYLWRCLKSRKLEGRKFRRQHSIGNYIVDFYCPEERLIVELDGKPHYNFINETYDQKREEYFISLKLKVIRFENKEVFENLDMVLEAIKLEFQQPPRPAATPPSKGGEL